MNLTTNQWKILRELYCKGKTGNHPGILEKLTKKGLVDDWLGGPNTTKKADKILREKYGKENF